MTAWRASKAHRVLAALTRLGWRVVAGASGAPFGLRLQLRW